MKFCHPILGDSRVSSVEVSVAFSVEKMSVEKNMTLNSTIYNSIGSNLKIPNLEPSEPPKIEPQTYRTSNLLLEIEPRTYRTS